MNLPSILAADRRRHIARAVIYFAVPAVSFMLFAGLIVTLLPVHR